MKTEKCNCIGCQIDKIDNPITPEINKAVAEAMGEKTYEKDGTLWLSNNVADFITSDIHTSPLIWQPDKDAEQNDLVQEHFKIDVEYDEINDVWIASKGMDIHSVIERDKSRKTAVVLAANEFIINSLNK